MRRNLFWLSEERWARIEPHLPTDVRGVERVDDCRVISGIVRVQWLPLVRLRARV
jgi:transposase